MHGVGSVFELRNETCDVSTQTAGDESSHYSLFFCSIQICFSSATKIIYLLGMEFFSVSIDVWNNVLDSCRTSSILWQGEKKNSLEFVSEENKIEHPMHLFLMLVDSSFNVGMRTSIVAE